MKRAFLLARTKRKHFLELVDHQKNVTGIPLARRGRCDTPRHVQCQAAWISRQVVDQLGRGHDRRCAVR